MNLFFKINSSLAVRKNTPTSEVYCPNLVGAMGTQTNPHNVKNFAMFILGICAWCGLCQFHIDYKFSHGKVIFAGNELF